MGLARDVSRSDRCGVPSPVWRGPVSHEALEASNLPAPYAGQRGRSSQAENLGCGCLQGWTQGGGLRSRNAAEARHPMQLRSAVVGEGPYTGATRLSACLRRRLHRCSPRFRMSAKGVTSMFPPFPQVCGGGCTDASHSPGCWRTGSHRCSPRLQLPAEGVTSMFLTLPTACGGGHIAVPRASNCPRRG